MALEHAILVSLTEQSGTGYELARRFDKSMGFFISASHQQIYRTLKRMDADGWVACETVEQEGRPDKKIYTISESGREELSRWIAEPSRPTFAREELGVKLRGAAHGDTPALLDEIVRHRDVHDQRLQLFRLLEKRDFPAPDRLTGTQLHQYLVLRGGIRVEEGFTQWCDEVLDALRPRPQHPTPTPESPTPESPTPESPTPESPTPEPGKAPR